MTTILCILLILLLIQGRSMLKIPFAISNSQANISMECRDQLTQFVKNLNDANPKAWALKMFNSNGDFPTGIIEGIHVDLGNFDECLNVNEIVGDAKLTGKYCLGRYYIYSLPGLLQKFSNITDFVTLGTCVPSVCSSYEIEQVYDAVGMHVSIDGSSCQTEESAATLDAFAVVTTIFLLVLMAVITVSTIYDVYFKQDKLTSIYTAFSVWTNGKKCLFDTLTAREGQITCLYGIRFLSMMWIILYHTVILRVNYNARKFGQNINQDTVFYIISSSGVLAVDTFLLMGGMLVSLNELKAISANKQFNILKHYISRYIRLTPVLMVLVLIHTSFGSLLGSGPLWYTVDQQNPCKSYWWTAIVHIQNYFESHTTCIMGSWYVSLDAQLILLSPILLIPLRKMPKLAIILTIVLAICSTVFTLILPYTFIITNIEDYYSYFYRPTHTRATSWLIGIIIGYSIFKAKQNPPSINKRTWYIFWTMSIIVMTACIYIGPDVKYTTEEFFLSNSLRLAFLRPLWCTAVAWLIYASCINPRIAVNRFLSLPIFDVLSRLTFSVYLVHTNIIFLRVMAARSIVQFSITETIIQFGGFLVIAILAGVVFTLSVEMPIITLEKLFWIKN